MWRIGGAAIVAIVLATAAPTAGSDPSAAAGVTIPVPAIHILLLGQPHFLVSDAVEGALRRLSRPRCQSLLAEFKDGAGDRLSETLARTGRTATQYLAELRFADGEGTKPCALEHVVAATMPGSRVVFICGQRFDRQFRPEIAAGEYIILHEMLHSLGLGENPPSSAAITAAVATRCGD
jgi:hypothetical protein